MALNKVLLIGNVGADPEIRYFEGGQGGNGRKVANFRLATSERYKDRNGEQREVTEWHSVVVWGFQADVVEKYVKKGTQLYVEGKIRTRQWTDKSGNTRYTTEIQADSLQLLGRRDSQSGDSGYESAASYTPPPTSYSAPTQSFEPPQPAAPPQAPAQAQEPAPTPVVQTEPGGDEVDDLPF